MLSAFSLCAIYSFHVALIAYCLAKMENFSEQEALKALAMGVFHDLAEARTGDQDFIAKNYVQVDEGKAVRDQFNNLEFGSDLKALIEEYEIRETKVSQCAKDADRLQQVYLEWSLAWQGNKLAEHWFESDYKNRLPYFYTQSAKDLMMAMKDSNPHEWWLNEFSGENINLKNLNG